MSVVGIVAGVAASLLVAAPTRPAPAGYAGVARATTTTTGVPTGDAFYRPPVPLPRGKPGTVIRAEPIPAPPGASAWRVLAHSRDPQGRNVAVSGFVVAPAGPAPSPRRPVVAWAHGTTGLADGCAPSRSDDAVARTPWAADFVAAGYVVAATDYHGLGTPGVHPYLVGASEGAAVLDLVRAARHLPAGAGRRVLVAGHSQGGHAALFAGEMAAAYAPELRVLGIAPGAPVSDVGAFLAHASTRPALTGFVVMGALGYTVAYPELAGAPVLTPAAATKANLALEACAGDVLLAFAGDDPAEVFLAAPAGAPAWTRRLEENRAGMRPAGAPLLVWQGAADDLVPAALTADFVARVCARGGAVDYREYPGSDHATVLGAAHDDVLAFFAARVRGDRLASTCDPAGAR